MIAAAVDVLMVAMNVKCVNARQRLWQVGDFARAGGAFSRSPDAAHELRFGGEAKRSSAVVCESPLLDVVFSIGKLRSQRVTMREPLPVPQMHLITAPQETGDY